MKHLQDRVLVLNASYEPMGTMGISHAMKKISRDAEHDTLQVLEWMPNREITTSKGAFPIPSVLRLKYHVDLIKRKNRAGAKRDRIFMRDRFRCQYCNVRMGSYHPVFERKLTRSDLTLDHILPKSRGGATAADNLVTACKPCNQRKSDRTPQEARMPLLTPQTLLRVHLDTMAICQYADYIPEWKKYLFLDNQGDTQLAHVGEYAYG